MREGRCQADETHRVAVALFRHLGDATVLHRAQPTDPVTPQSLSSQHCQRPVCYHGDKSPFHLFTETITALLSTAMAQITKKNTPRT